MESKDTFQDMKPRIKRSIRDIPIPKKRSSRAQQDGQVQQKPEAVQEEEYHEPNWGSDNGYDAPSRQSYVEGGGGKNRRWRIWAVAGVALVLAIFAVSVIFENAQVRVTPKTQILTVDTTIEAGRVGSIDSTLVPYDVVEYEVERTREVASADASDVSTRARGTLIVYNNHSEDDFDLVDQTRFESPDGKIYRIQKAISVPGRTSEGAETIPGTLEIEVVADEVGSEYNLGVVEFTVPGLEGSDAFSEIYAKTKSVIEGGSSEGEIVISQDDRKRAMDELESEIIDALYSRVENEMPNGYVFFDSLSPTHFETFVEQTDNSGKALVRVQGSIKAVLVEENELAQKILDRPSIEGGQDLSVSIPDVSTLAATYMGQGSFDPDIGDIFSFAVTGNAELVWNLDKRALADELKGVSRKAFSEIMERHEEINSVDLVIRPLWKRSFPDDPRDIKVINVFYENQE